TFVGYGGTGTGATGWQYSEEPAPRRVGSNRFDDDWTLFHQGGPVNLPQYAAPGSALLFDFDDGSSGHDFFGHFFGRPATGLGAAESMFYRGDSGGPAFLDGQVAGVGWIFGSVHGSGQDTDVDGTTDGSFGEFSSYVRTGSYQGFIDSAVSGRYTLVFDMNYQPQQVGGVNGGRSILTVQRSGDHLQLNYNGTTDTAVYRIADIDALVIRGSDRDDAVNLEDLAGVLPGGVSFDGRGGQNTLYVLDTIGSTFRPTSAHAGTIDGGVTYQNVDELIGSGTAHTLTLAGLAGGVTAAVQANYYGNDPGGLQAAYATATITTPDGLSLHVQGLDTFVGTPGFDRLTGPDQGTWTIDGPG